MRTSRKPTERKRALASGREGWSKRTLPRGCRRALGWGGCLWFVGMLQLEPGSAVGQEIFRNPVPRAESAEARQVNLEALPFTFKAGDFRLLVTPSFEADWVDNINLVHEGALNDFILRPMIQFDGSYPLTDRNLLQFNVGLGYDIYAKHSEFDALRLVTGSGIAFDTYIKDFAINVHDRFHYIQDPAEEAAVATTARFGGLDNTAGLSVTWDQQDLLLTGGYDHENFLSTSGAYEYLNRASELLYAQAAFRIHPKVLTGVEGGGSFTSYDEAVLNRNVGYNAGAFAEWRPGQYLRVEAHGGYSAYLFDQTSRVLTAVDQYAWYGRITATHQVTDFFYYSLSAGRELRLGTEADFIKAWYVRPGIEWHLVHNLKLNAYLAYEHGDQGQPGQGGAVVETYDWMGMGFGLSQPITENLAATLRYRHTLRQSDKANREYTQNLVGILLTYQFR